MNVHRLTNPAFRAHNVHMGKIRVKSLGIVMLATMGLGGCISLEAPDKPIVIELNINITSEVTVRLADDAGNTIEENSDIF